MPSLYIPTSNVVYVCTHIIPIFIVLIYFYNCIIVHVIRSSSSAKNVYRNILLLCLCTVQTSSDNDETIKFESDVFHSTIPEGTHFKQQ